MGRLAFCRSSVPAGTPGLVQYVSKSIAITAGGTWSANGLIYLPLPNGSKAGNVLVLFLRVDGNVDTTDFQLADDQTNAWSAGTSAYNSTGDESLVAFYAVNVAANTRALTIKNVSGGALSEPAVMAAEYYNAGALDVAVTHTGSSATMTAGSGTPVATGDLVVQAAIRTSTRTTTAFTPGSQSNITWQLAGPNLLNGHTMQWGVYHSTSALNPTLTAASSDQFASVALFFLSSSAGSARSAGIQVVGITGLDFRPGDFATSQGIQASVYGNLLVLLYAGGIDASAPTLTAVSDGDGNTWATCGAGVENNTRVGAFHGRNMTANSALALTTTWNVDTGDFTLQVYDVIGASATPLDQSGTASDHQDISGDLTTASVTPTTSNGLCLVTSGQAFNTMSGCVGAGFLFDSCRYDGQSLDGPSTPDENNGWAHYYNPNTSPVTFVFTEKDGSELPRNWAAQAVSFKAA